MLNTFASVVLKETIMLFNLVSTLALFTYCLLQLIRCQAIQPNDDDYDTVYDTLRTEKLVHSGSLSITKTSPCVQVSASDVTIEKAIGKLSKKLVEIDPLSKFDIGFCGSDNDGSKTCAVDALCTTVYRWQKARTRSMIFGTHEIYIEDKVLLPSSCTCMMGKTNEKTGALFTVPVITF